MYQLSCEVCARPSETLTPDRKHVVCSFACKEKLDGCCEEEKKTLTSHGVGQVRVVPDRVRIRLDIRRGGATFAEVDQHLVEAADNLIDLLKSDGRVEKIQTSNLTIEPLYEKETDEEEDKRRERKEARKIVEYEGHFPVSFETEVGQAGALFALSLKNNYASTVEGLDYIVSDAIAENAYTMALQKASIDAERKALVVLETLGLTKKAVISINIHSSDYAAGPMVRADSMSSFAGKLKMKKASIQLMAPEEKVEAKVNIVLSYY